MITVLSARVAQPNTPETDAMAQVQHIVTFSNGDTATVMASDPGDAIEEGRRMAQTMNQVEAQN